MRSPLSINPVSVSRQANLTDAAVANDREPTCELAHAEFSRWMDAQLESLENRFQAYTTRSSLAASMGR